MKRRDFLKAAGAGLGAAGAAAVASPAIAQSAPELKWRLASSFPKSLETLYGTAEHFAKVVGELTDNKFQIQVFGPGEIVPAFQVADAVANNTVEIAHTASYYFWGKDPTFAFGTAVPFGLNYRMQHQWMYEEGGIDQMNEFYAKFGLYGLPGGNTGTQMGGWFRKEINTLDDLKGLKMRIAGFGGAVMQKLGVIAQQVPGGEIYPSIERGTIDAAEWVGPYDDQKLGLYKVAKYYYYPGWWEGQAMLHLFFNKEKFEGLPASYKAVLRAAAHQANTVTMARYDKLNPKALKELVANGAVLRQFNETIMAAAFKAATETFEEISAKNADFKKMYETMKAIRADGFLWEQVGDGSFDNFMMAQQRKRAL